MQRKFVSAIFVLLLGLSVVACGGAGPVAPQAARVAAPATNVAPQAYHLGSGDRLRVIVYGEESLSGEFQVDGDGYVALPLVGEVLAGGLTLREFEREAADSFSQGYLRDPRISVEVLNFRPFYIIGEVQSGGEYPFSQGMTVLNAVAVAGGYTYRADRSRVFITRANSGGEVEYSVSQGVNVLPGDIVRVPERFF